MDITDRLVGSNDVGKLREEARAEILRLRAELADALVAVKRVAAERDRLAGLLWRPAVWAAHAANYNVVAPECDCEVGTKCSRPACCYCGEAVPANVRSPLGAEPSTAGWRLVPVEPSAGLLMSMAIRFDHGLGVPGHYDNPRMGGVGHARRLEATIGTMRQLHEEVVGSGFYRIEKEADYAALGEASLKAPAHG